MIVQKKMINSKEKNITHASFVKENKAGDSQLKSKKPKTNKEKKGLINCEKKN